MHILHRYLVYGYRYHQVVCCDSELRLQEVQGHEVVLRGSARHKQTLSNNASASPLWTLKTGSQLSELPKELKEASALPVSTTD